MTSILSNPFTISAAGVATLAFVSQPTNATAGNTLSSVSVKALDRFGNVVPGASVSIGITPGTLASGTLTQTTGVTGLALFGNLVEDVTGTYSLIASATGATSTASNSFIITAAAAANLSFLSQPSSTTAGSVLNPVTVQVADKFGNAVPSTSIGVALSPGTLSTGTTPLVANALGQVVFGDLSEDKIGTYSLTASAAALSISSSQFTITPSLATAKLSFISQPNSTIAGTILHPITVQIADQYNNPISGVSIGVALSMGTLSAGTTPLVSSTAGQVVFNDLAEDTVGTYSLVASAPAWRAHVGFLRHHRGGGGESLFPVAAEQHDRGQHLELHHRAGGRQIRQRCVRHLGRHRPHAGHAEHGHDADRQRLDG